MGSVQQGKSAWERLGPVWHGLSVQAWCGQVRLHGLGTVGNGKVRLRGMVRMGWGRHVCKGLVGFGWVCLY